MARCLIRTSTSAVSDVSFTIMMFFRHAPHPCACPIMAIHKSISACEVFFSYMTECSYQSLFYSSFCFYSIIQ
jgi:hypothetical protein